MSQFLSTIVAQTFAPREYELPIFIHSKFLNPTDDSSARRRQLKAHTSHYRGYYNARTRRRHRPSPPPTVADAACPDRQPTAPPIKPRFPTSNRTDKQLAPNRYRLDADSLAERVRRSGVGRRGPYECFSGSRDANTMRGHLALSADILEQRMFYDVPAGGEVLGLRNPRQYFRYKIRSDSRGGQDEGARKRWLAAFRRQPGPAEFYPQNYVSVQPAATFVGCKQPMRLARDAYFPAGSCVPVNDRFWRPELSVFRPAPGRYNVAESMSKRHRIAGSGHTHVFRSRVVRLLRAARKGSTTVKERTSNRPPPKPQMKLDAAYLHRIRDPARSAISFPNEPATPEAAAAAAAVATRPIRFNTIERPMKRSRLRNNAKVAFNSGTTRWPQNPNEQGWMHKRATTETSAKPKRPAAETTGARPPRATRTTMVAETAAERLQRMPARFEGLLHQLDRSNKMRNTFAALPPPRILVEDRLDVDEDRLELLNTKADVEALYTEEVLQLKRDWEERKQLLGLT